MCKEDELSFDKNETQKFQGNFNRDYSETVFSREVFQQHSSLSQLFNDKFVKQIELPQLVEQIPCYIINPHYLLKNVSLNDWSRARLINWMMEVGSQMHFNRWTVHLGVEYFDRFFSKCKETFSQMNLQDYTLILLSVAAKQNEVKIPNVTDFIMNASQSQTSKQLIEYEVIILNKLQWNLHPYTHIQQLSNILLGLQIFCQQYRPSLQFLQYEVQSTWFEGFMNVVKHLCLKPEVVDYLYKYLELFLIDAENLIYPQKTLCFGLVYVALGLDLQQFDEQNLRQMKNSSRYLLSENPFNQFFAEYLKEFGIEITEILCSVQYVSGLFNLVKITQKQDSIKCFDNLTIIKNKYHTTRQ